MADIYDSMTDLYADSANIEGQPRQALEAP